MQFDQPNRREFITPIGADRLRHHSPIATLPDEVTMQANLMKMGFGLLYSLATAVVFLVLFSGSPAVAAGEGEAFIFLPGGDGTRLNYGCKDPGLESWVDRRAAEVAVLARADDGDRIAVPRCRLLAPS